MSVAEEPQPARSVLDAALEAWDAGLCVIPGRADGTKRPQGTWEEWQTTRPSRSRVEQWFRNGHPALMIVCGQVSGVEMLELEGRAMDAGIADKIDARLHELGLGELLMRIVSGYCERTPSGGLHLLYRCSAIDPNTKLARNAAGEVLIETRGEGGVVMVAPSHGPTHTTGVAWELTDGGFSTIATITPDERDALFAVMAEFDEAGPEAAAVIPPTPPRPVKPWAGGPVGESWFAAVADHLAAEMTLRQRLEGYGWTFVKSDQRGDLMRRPGKTTGISARINHSGRLMNWSSSAPFPVAAGQHRPTFDHVDVVAAYEHRGDRKACTRTIAERTGILRAWQAQQDAALLGTTGRQNAPGPPPGVDPETGELLAPQGNTEANPGTPAPPAPPSSVNLPESFWAERPELTHIRQAAHARARSADAVFGCVLARVAAVTHPCWTLPAIVGAESTVSLYVAISGRSGDGKSTGASVAKRLMPTPPDTVVDDRSLGSGEGLIEVYHEWVDEERPGGKGTSKVKRKTREGALMMLDEGSALAQLSSRQGSTLAPNLRSAWTGATVGSANASTETTRHLAELTYALGLIIGIQPSLANALLDDTAGGLPQRFLWVSSTDPTIPDDAPEWPGRLPFVMPPVVRMGGGFTVAPAIWTEIRRHDLARQRAEVVVDELDAHANLLRLKVAACLALLAGRTDVTDDDWRLAGVVRATSNAVRAVVLETVRMEARKVDDARALAAVRRETLVADSATAKALDSMARSIARRVHQHAAAGRCEGGCARRCAHASTASKHRELVPLADAIDRAVELSWVAVDGDRLRPGKGQPA